MRDDLAKVICEKERRGDRTYNAGIKKYDERFYPKHDNEHHDEEYYKLDCLPTSESMTKRLGWNKRSFSENLGAIRGLIVKNVGKNWDKLYSQICEQVSPTGTNVERHVHQHIEGYIETKTRIGENNEIQFNDGYSDWQHIKYCWPDYYVHPISRCITKVNKVKRVPYYTRIDIEKQKYFKYIDGKFFAFLKNNWFILEAKVQEKKEVIIWDDRKVLVDVYKGIKIDPNMYPISIHQFIIDNKLVFVSKKSASHKELKDAKII